MSFFGGTPDRFLSHDNPYIGQLAGLNYKFPKMVMKGYRDTLRGYQQGNYSKLPGQNIFDNEIAKLNDTAQYQSGGLTTGPAADRVRQLNVDRGRDAINEQRFGFVQNQIDNAQQGLMSAFDRRNQFDLNKFGQAAGLENSRYQFVPGKPGFGGQLLGGLAGSLFPGIGAGFSGLFGSRNPAQGQPG